jgi:flagellar biogenesis protein FliO
MQAAPTDAVASTTPPRFARWIDAIRAFLQSFRIRRRVRSLQICETLPLGEKRFLAVVQFEGRRFLIGATNQSISLLDKLDSASTQRQKQEVSLKTSYWNGVH